MKTKQKYSVIKKLLFTGLWVTSICAQAVPVLQVGAPGGSGEGIYANYQPSTINPTEADTAITGSTTLYFAGVFGPNTVFLGGQGSGNDYSGVDTQYTLFNGHGAIAVVSVADGQGATAALNLTVGGALAFHESATLSNLFPNNHDPLKDNISDFLFFDIGNFSNIANAVPDFASETGAANGEIKALTIAGLGSLAWAHFDLVALETTSTGSDKNSSIKTTFENNPGSHDVTWRSGGGGGGQGGQVPEPDVLALFGIGLVGMGLSGIRIKRKAN